MLTIKGTLPLGRPPGVYTLFRSVSHSFSSAAIFRRGNAAASGQTRSIRGRIKVTGIDVKRNTVAGRRDLIFPLICEMDQLARISILLRADNEFASVCRVNFNLISM